MARATQGLQIALIISVMLNVVLGVTTYLYNKQAFEKTGQAKAEVDRAQQAARDKQAAEEKFDRARKVIGLPESDIDQIEKKLEDRQVDFGVAPSGAGDAAKAAGDAGQKPVGAPGYDQMVERLRAIRDERTGELKTTKAQVATLQKTFHDREAAKDAAVASYDKGFNDEKQHIHQIESEYHDQQQTMSQNEAKVASDAKGAGRKAIAMFDQARNERDALVKQQKVKDDELKKAITIIRNNDRQDIDPPSGEVTWVSLPTKTVWIDRGRADSLPRGIRFTVYAAESNTSAKAVPKGTVEVTRIVADHQAECRIVDDKFADPITSGDKVFTAFWAPGQQNHFALSGVMDLDGDKHNQVNTAIGLVKSFGGVVDCWLDDQGRRHGTITPSTQYWIKGDSPAANFVRKATAISNAMPRTIRLKVWTLSDFKQRLNYQKSSSVEDFGSGASSSGDAAPPPAAKAPKAAKAAPPPLPPRRTTISSPASWRVQFQARRVGPRRHVQRRRGQAGKQRRCAGARLPAGALWRGNVRPCIGSPADADGTSAQSAAPPAPSSSLSLRHRRSASAVSAGGRTPGQRPARAIVRPSAGPPETTGPDRPTDGAAPCAPRATGRTS